VVLVHLFIYHCILDRQGCVASSFSPHSTSCNVCRSNFIKKQKKRESNTNSTIHSSRARSPSCYFEKSSICSLCSFCSSFCSQTEHLIQIYTLRFFIDFLISSIKQLYQSIRMDVIDVTYALIRSKTANIRI